MERKRIVVVGGVAGGASCAARARRLTETAEIIMFDRGEYVSFANCGLPYYVGDVIKKEKHLLIATPKLFRKRFEIDVRLRSEVLAIDRENSHIQVKNLQTGEIYHESYDALVLSPGARPIKPQMSGVDLPGIFSLRTIPDSRQIKAWITQHKAKRAVVVGGGYIGMEMTENLLKLGLAVTIVEMQNQVMPLMDPEMVTPIQDDLLKNKVVLRLNETVAGFAGNDDHTLSVKLNSGLIEKTDLVILSIGVRPEIQLAQDAGLKIGKQGGIRVDEHMRTSDEKIWAVGDAVEVKDLITGQWGVIPLAGPANRQGRIAADVIMGRDERFRGVQGTSVVGILDLVAAFTGPSEKTLRRLGIWDESAQYEKVYLHPGDHAGYYPGSNPISLKLIFDKKDGRIISAQAVGKEGVAKRIDVISMAIQQNATVFDLEEAELCYAPQFGSAKDPVNLAGMIAANVLRGDVHIVHWENLDKDRVFMLDVRDPSEYKKGCVEGAVNIPLNDLRQRMGEVPKEQEVWSYCLVGQRSYYAARALSQYGYDIKSLSGGYMTFTSKDALDPGLRVNTKK
ncbi:Putative pyridine nucleotide-disulphide oxidoreductase [Olavius sp. associated proteobacterium Delta 1]|nr:Putative pyridine nucleotide-disulphide oxidoreductase [Olavius sp. associated proteobacterium Delta 1]